jgi:hypothetical protein
VPITGRPFEPIDSIEIGIVLWLALRFCFLLIQQNHGLNVGAVILFMGSLLFFAKCELFYAREVALCKY